MHNFFNNFLLRLIDNTSLVACKLLLPVDERSLCVLVDCQISDEDPVLGVDDAALTCHRDGRQDVVSRRHDRADFALFECGNHVLGLGLHLVLHDEQAEESQIRLHLFSRDRLRTAIVKTSKILVR